MKHKMPVPDPVRGQLFLYAKGFGAPNKVHRKKELRMLTAWIERRIGGDVKDERVRSAYGKAASIVGIGCNVLLFAGKMLVGLLSGSVAITADAVNNLSDASSSIISLLGFKMADRPADAEIGRAHV